jgi:hypothetical protein
MKSEEFDAPVLDVDIAAWVAALSAWTIYANCFLAAVVSRGILSVSFVFPFGRLLRSRQMNWTESESD